jgi:hypothetical protein
MQHYTTGEVKQRNSSEGLLRQYLLYQKAGQEEILNVPEIVTRNTFITLIICLKSLVFANRNYYFYELLRQ